MHNADHNCICNMYSNWLFKALCEAVSDFPTTPTQPCRDSVPLQCLPTLSVPSYRQSKTRETPKIFPISACLTSISILLEFISHLFQYKNMQITYHLSIDYNYSPDMAFLNWTKWWMGTFWTWSNSGVPLREVIKMLLKGPMWKILG